MPHHRVKQGECISLIALHHGFQDWKPIYEHPNNESLRRTRPHPHILHPGDVVFIPEPASKTKRVLTGHTHGFTLKRPTRELLLTLRDGAGEPLVFEPYVLEVGAESIEGATDSEGSLQEPIPSRVSSAVLTVGARTYVLDLAHLNPADETDDQGVSGVQARLRNLGFDPGAVDGVLSERTRQALCAFEALHGLPIRGEPEGETLARLKQAHGC